MNKIKALLLGFVKPLILAHVNDLSMLVPMLSKELQDKAKLTPASADPLAVDLVNMLEAELVKLINKL